MTTAVVLFSVGATLLIILTGLLCYRQGQQDATTDIDPMTELGARIVAHLMHESVGTSVLVRMTRDSEDTYTGHVLPPDTAQPLVGASEPAAGA